MFNQENILLHFKIDPGSRMEDACKEDNLVSMLLG